MPREYNLNPESAKKAEQFSTRITETGKYVGTLTHAVAVTASTGTEGIEFGFKADTGATADYLSIWCSKSDGTELSGTDTVNAIMTCLQIRNIKPEAGSYEAWDPDSKTRINKRAVIYPALTGKKIGLLLQKEQYLKQDQTIGETMRIAVPFDAVTGRSAGEILAKQIRPEAIERIASSLKDRLVKSAARSPSSSGGAAPTGGIPDDFDNDSIPF